MKKTFSTIKAPVTQLTRFVINLHELSYVLTDDEIMDLEFIKAFGVKAFVKAADKDCLKKLGNFNKAINFKRSVLLVHPAWYDYAKNSKRATRRLTNVMHRTRAIKLGSKNIFNEGNPTGSLLRASGIVFNKAKKAKKTYYGKKFSHTQVQAFKKDLRNCKHYMRLAGYYNDFTILYCGRFFKDR